jgi:hypothetical protein
LLRKGDIRFVKETIPPHASPVLSLYMDVNPAKPENARRAWLVQAKDALRDLPNPREVEKIVEKIELVGPQARMCAVFAGNDLMKILVSRRGRCTME